MGQTAEILAHRFDISREMMDSFAMRSHLRLDHGQQHGHLDEIEVMYDNRGNFYDHDDGVRADSTMEKLAKLRPVFDRPVGNARHGTARRQPVGRTGSGTNGTGPVLCHEPHYAAPRTRYA